METAARPHRRRLVWIILVLLAVLVAGSGGCLWYVLSQLGMGPDGSRLSLVMPGGTVGLSAQGPMAIALAADLAAAGLKAEHEGLQAEMEQSGFFLRERFALRVRLTAGNQPVETKRLGYVLLDAGGKVLSEGPLQPQVRIPAEATETVQIVNPHLPDTKRVEIRKLP